MAEHSQMGKIVLHLGAHRTGTSSFQNYLHLNRDVLARKGCDVYVPNRDGITNARLNVSLPEPRHVAANADMKVFVRRNRRNLRAMGWDAASTRTTLLSEENLPGRMIHFWKGHFYPQAGIRCRVLAKALRRRIDHAVLVVRDYGDLYTSAHAMFAQRKCVADFRTRLPALMSVRDGWSTLIAEVLKGLDPARLTIVPYDMRGPNSQLLATLAGCDMHGLRNLEWRVNQPASVQAMERLQKIYSAGGRLTECEVHGIKEEFSVDRGYDRFDPLTKAERRLFTNRYRSELLMMEPDARIEILHPELIAAE